MRYFITFAYDGTAYHGWQVQPGGVDTVQARFNDALTRLLGVPTECVGAGRTDTGVHASQMVAHFDTDHVIDCAQLAYRLNRIVPRDIAVSEVRPVPDDFHARFSAVRRTYHYYVYTHKAPFRRHYALQLHFAPDYALMNKAASRLLEVSDFTSFSKVNNDQKTNICHVTHAEWVQIDTDLWRFEITANRFLRNMVRAVVGTLLEVGRGRLTLDDFERVITERDRCSAGESVAANALFLVEVAYE